MIDIRGHGDSEGIRGDVPFENALIEDLNHHLKDLKSKSPQVNIFIGGHSMGAGISGRYLEYYGYNSVKGVVYISPLFHYRQSGMKSPGYVENRILKILFGGDHEICQIYHPSSNDEKLVREYTNMMRKATMVFDYPKFRKDHNTNTIIIISKNDELFNWKKTIQIFNDRKIKYIITNSMGHLDFNFTKELGEWINHL